MQGYYVKCKDESIGSDRRYDHSSSSCSHSNNNVNLGSNICEDPTTMTRKKLRRKSRYDEDNYALADQSSQFDSGTVIVHNDTHEATNSDRSILSKCSENKGKLCCILLFILLAVTALAIVILFRSDSFVPGLMDTASENTTSKTNTMSSIPERSTRTIGLDVVYWAKSFSKTTKLVENNLETIT